jgi:hypothetical protein
MIFGTSMCEEDSDLEQYMKIFVQPTPRYGIKSPGEEWRSVEGSITRDLVMSHWMENIQSQSWALVSRIRRYRYRHSPL